MQQLFLKKLEALKCICAFEVNNIFIGILFLFHFMSVSFYFEYFSLIFVSKS